MVGTTCQEMLDRPAPCITSKGHDTGRDAERPSRRPIAELRAMLDGSGLLDRPSTTIAADPRLVPAGHHEHARGNRGDVNVGPAELAVLQGFPLDYRFTGNKTSQYRQIGNAVPPALGGAVVTAIARALGT